MTHSLHRSGRAILSILTLACVLFSGIASAATYTLAPLAYQTVLDTNGNPVSGAKICTYLAGTTTPTATFSDSGGTQNANPITADSSGRFVAYLLPGASYKFIFQDATGTAATCNGVVIRTQDNISAVPPVAGNVDITGTAGEALTAGQVAYLSDGSGSKVAGQWYKADNTNAYSSITTIVGLVPTSIASTAAGTIRIAGSVPGLSSLSIGATYYIGTAGAITSTPPTNRRPLGVADSATSLLVQPWPLASPPTNTGLAQGRLTLTTATPVTTADVTGAGTVYYTPYGGNLIALYDGTATWTNYPFTEQSIALSGLVNAQAYDVFAFATAAGAVNIETAEWANATATMTIAAPGVVTWTAHGLATGNAITFTTTGALPTGVTAGTQYFVTVVDANTFKLSTTLANVAAGTFITTSGSQSGTHTGHQPQGRQTALALQNGVLVKSGATTRRYLGSFLTTSSSATEDSASKRFLFNYYNRVKRTLRATDTTDTWTYTTAAFRQANASTANQVGVLVGVAEVAVEIHVGGNATNGTGATGVAVGIGEDSTNTAISGSLIQQSTANVGVFASPGSELRRYPTVGLHDYIWLEISSVVGTTTWYGDNGTTSLQSGLHGSIEG